MITELANATAGLGHCCVVLTLASTERDHYRLDPNIERIALNVMWDSHSLWESLVGNFRRTLMIRRALQACKPDVVISFIEQNNVRVLVASLGASFPVLVSERTDPRRHRVSAAWRIARRILYPIAARLVVQTRSVAQWANGVTRAERIVVIPNFVRALPLPSLASMREKNRLLAVGRLGYEKGFDVLLRAFGQSGLAEQGIRLTILGEGPERQTLERLSRDLGISGHVDMPGVVSDPERWMAQATVYVLPSRYEGFPNALLEAMAMGCPVIATDCASGPGEILRHEKNGLLIPVDDTHALAAGMTRLFDDETFRQRLGDEAVAVREHYSRTALLDRWLSLIEEVV
jgi:GalNAc-alpha-(1->4)-GalNAc-alpha-(1->3)-diNAcBac-PP-undecaprenol alpha-1,4-N-acetyl-D-galactosaminyltransferase